MNTFEFKRDLYRYILDGADVSNLIGNRLYANIAERGSQKPYIVYSEVGGDDEYCHDDTRAKEETRIQFDMVASSPAEADKIADALDRLLLSTTTPFIQGDTLFEFIHRQGGGLTQYDDTADNSGDLGIFRKTVDYNISWQPKTTAGYPE